MSTTNQNRDFTMTLAGHDSAYDVLELRRATWIERVSQPFEAHLELVCDDPNLDLEGMIGVSVTIAMTLDDSTTRYFNGIVTRFTYTGSDGGAAVYHATLGPWLWFLSRTADCRIFQGETAPDVVLTVFRDNGFSDFESRVTSSDYGQREYLVQYRETDLNFVQRLLENEGIRYYFKHEDGKHTMVLANPDSALDSGIEGYESAEYFPPGDAGTQAQQRIFHWEQAHQAMPGFYCTTDYDYRNTTAQQEAMAYGPTRNHPHADREIFDYPGYYPWFDDQKNYDAGMNLATVRMEELYGQYEAFTGHGNYPGIAAGHLFELSNHPRDAHNQKYLILSAEHVMVTGYDPSGTTSSESTYNVKCTGIHESIPFRPRRITPKPTVAGPQTGTVIGPAGEPDKEIWTDDLGRVLVRFPWDRREGDHSADQSDQNRDLASEQGKDYSCWIRVSQAWAGKNWGTQFLPWPGHEVIVDFLEGDPDQPVVTGRLYNETNPPPRDLPAKERRTVILDSNGNEISMDSTPGDGWIQISNPDNNNILRMDSNGAYISTGGNETSFTGGSKSWITYGEAHSMFLGMKLGIHIGTNISISGGVKLSLSVGADAAATLGVGYAFTWAGKASYDCGFRVENVKEEKAATSNASLQRVKTDWVVDAEKRALITAGATDESKVLGDGDNLVLVYGKGSAKTDGAADQASNAKLKAFLAAAGGAVGAAVGSTVAFIGAHDAKVESGELEETDPIWGANNDAAMWAGGAIATVSALGGAAFYHKYVAAAKADQTKLADQIADYAIDQSQVFAEIKLNEDGVTINAKDGSTVIGQIILNQKNKEITIHAAQGNVMIGAPDGECQIYSSKKLLLKSDDSVVVEAPDNMFKSSGFVD